MKRNSDPQYGAPGSVLPVHTNSFVRAPDVSLLKLFLIIFSKFVLFVIIFLKACLLKNKLFSGIYETVERRKHYPDPFTKI